MSQETKDSRLASLQGVAGPELEKDVQSFREERAADTRTLLEFATKSSDALQSSQRVDANSGPWHTIKLLGDLRSIEAAPLLAKLIAVRDTSFSLISNESPHWYSFPAAVALSKIGMPAVEQLLVVLQTSAPDSTEFHLSCTTLEAIMGPKLALVTVKSYGDHFPALAEKTRLAAMTSLIQDGHKRWTADSAADFMD